MGVVSSEYLGLLNVPNDRKPSNHLLAVDFDTIQSVEFDDPDDNHVGVDINNLKSMKAKSVGYWNVENFHKFSLKSGHNIQAWIDYDHLQIRLNVS